MIKRVNNWKKIWQYRAKKYSGKSAVIIDGFDSGRGKISEEGLDYLIKKIRTLLALKRKDRLLEIGCGAGMLLEKLNLSHMAGVDYSSAMIAEVKKRVPKANFYVAEACDLPFQKPLFNKILAWSVFEYFPSLNYAEKVLSEILRCLKRPGIIFIGDIPDLTKYKEAEELEKNNPHRKEDFKEVFDLKHLYYPHSFFINFAKGHGLKYFFPKLIVPGYANSRVRFNLQLKS